MSQLREKQKARRIYGVLEVQFRNLYEEANRQSGITGENLLRLLELRLDNICYRARWASSRSQARQMVSHGNVLVNGRRVTIASFRTKPGDVISVDTPAREQIVIRQNLDLLDRSLPSWLEAEDNGYKVNVRIVPVREQIDTDVKEQLIVELYSK
jgi:small subunit ribosomal protein S4